MVDSSFETWHGIKMRVGFPWYGIVEACGYPWFFFLCPLPLLCTPAVLCGWGGGWRRSRHIAAGHAGLSTVVGRVGVGPEPGDAQVTVFTLSLWPDFVSCPPLWWLGVGRGVGAGWGGGRDVECYCFFSTSRPHAMVASRLLTSGQHQY